MAGSQPSSGQMSCVAIATSASATTTTTSSNGFVLTEEEIANVHKFIENALQLQLQGNDANYQFLLQQLKTTPTTSTTSTTSTNDGARLKILSALPRCISTISKEPEAYGKLMDLLLKYDFLSENPMENDLYMDFLSHLVSSNTIFIVPTLHLLIKNLCYPPVVVHTKDDNRVQRRFHYVHLTLQRVLTLVPSAQSTILFQILCEHFPHKRLEAKYQVAYVQNVLEMSTYVTSLQEKIYSLLLEQLVKIDVEIVLDEKEEQDFMMDFFTMDDFLEDNFGAEQVDEMADKLDQMLFLLFDHLNKRLTMDTKNELTLVSTFQHLVKVFEQSILNTHKSKYPQFVLFYICQFHTSLQDVFISSLLSSVMDHHKTTTPQVTKHSCWAYIASFLARAKYIQVDYLQKALYHLLKWMHTQVDILDNTASCTTQQKQDIEKKQEDTTETFDAINFIFALQTVCYLVCFRGLEIAQYENGQGYEFLRSLGWERLLTVTLSKHEHEQQQVLEEEDTTTTPPPPSLLLEKEDTLSMYYPFALCQSTVAYEFLNFAETFYLIPEEIIDLLDQQVSSMNHNHARTTTTKNKKTTTLGKKNMERSSVSTSSTSNTSKKLLEPLETFFPFDPFLLRRSFKFIGPLYLYWKHADPNSSENSDALHQVKKIMKKFLAEEEEEKEKDDVEEDNEISTRMSLSKSLQMGSSLMSTTSSFEEKELEIIQKNYLGLSVSVGSEEEEDAVGMGAFMMMHHSKNMRSSSPMEVRHSRNISFPREELEEELEEEFQVGSIRSSSSINSRPTSLLARRASLSNNRTSRKTSSTPSSSTHHSLRRAYSTSAMQHNTSTTSSTSSSFYHHEEDEEEEGF